jgi:hypothetical protein
MRIVRVPKPPAVCVASCIAQHPHTALTIADQLRIARKLVSFAIVGVLIK